MTNDSEIKIFACLDFLRDNAEEFANAKAQRTYLDEYRKTKKSLCMIEAEIKGAKSAAIQERDAYSNPEYIKLLEAIKIAVADEERLKWLMIAAQAKIEVWRTIESSRRYEAKTI
jgi:hypothetical protein